MHAGTYYKNSFTESYFFLLKFDRINGCVVNKCVRADLRLSVNKKMIELGPCFSSLSNYLCQSKNVVKWQMLVNRAEEECNHPNFQL